MIISLSQTKKSLDPQKIEVQALKLEEKSLGEEKSGRSKIQKLGRKTQQKADLKLC